MQNTKLIHFFKSLSKSEFREFDKFVRSPFFNNRKDVIKFFNTIKKYYPDFNIKKEDIYKILYPGKKYKSDVIILLNTYLYRIGKDFLVVKNLQQDKFFYNYHLLKKLNDQGADDLFEKEFNNAESSLNSEKLNKNYFFHKSLLEELRSDFDLERNRQDKSCKTAVDISNYQLFSFLVNLAQSYHEMYVNKCSFNYKFEGTPAESFLKHLDYESFIENFDSGNVEFNNYITYYYYFLMCYYRDDENLYFKFKEYAFKDFDKLSESERSGRFNCLTDYCLPQVKSGNMKFLRETFDLYKEALNRKLYHLNSDNSMGVIFFRNFVSLALAVKELDYIEGFIHKYIEEIKEDMREDLFELSCAMIYVERKQFEKALTSLLKVSNTFPFFKMSKRFILIKIYYETRQYDELFSLLDTYRQYIKKEKLLTEMVKQQHSYFIKNVLALTKVKSDRRQINNDIGYDLSVIKKDLMNNLNMDFRHKLWLIEKIDELEHDKT